MLISSNHSLLIHVMPLHFRWSPFCDQSTCDKRSRCITFPLKQYASRLPAWDQGLSNVLHVWFLPLGPNVWMCGWCKELLDLRNFSLPLSCHHLFCDPNWNFQLTESSHPCAMALKFGQNKRALSFCTWFWFWHSHWSPVPPSAPTP